MRIFFAYINIIIICSTIAHRNPEDYIIKEKLNSLNVSFEENALYMGMEIEIIYMNNTDKNKAIISFADLLPTKYFSNWALQNEYSLPNCVEYTSYPLDYENMLDEISKIVAFINMSKGYTSIYTGIHIHVSRKSIEKYKPYDYMTTYDYHKYLWWKINNKNYRKKWIKLAGRITTYAIFDNLCNSFYDAHVAYSNNNDYMVGSSNYIGRNMALNLMPKKTIEFRMFKSIINYNKIKQYINKVHNVITNNDDYNIYLTEMNNITYYC